ncbi:MAG: kelch repeat-containing protein [Bacteroidota bacterium]
MQKTWTPLFSYLSRTLIFLIFITEANAQWVEIPGDNPPVRKEHGMIEINGGLLIFGGKDDQGDLGDTWVFSDNEWFNQYPQVSPGPRHGHTAVKANGKMYLFGGSGTGSLLNDLWEYCPDNNMWNLITTSGSAPSPRKGHAAVYYEANNTIYIIGGTTANGNSSQLFALDLTTKQWTEKPDMLNFSLTNHGAAILNDFLVIFGGNSLFADFSDFFFTFDLTDEFWNSVEDIDGDFPGRSDFSTTYDDNTIHVMGGKGPDNTLFDDHIMMEMDLDGTGITMIQDPGESIFADGFESGDASAWTDSSPKNGGDAPVQILMFGGAGADGALLDKTWYYTNCVAVTDSLTMSICEGESFEGYSEEGTYEDTFEAENGCDSIRVLELSVLPNADQSLAIHLCFGETFEAYDESGTYEDVFTGSNGCDSIRTLELTIDEQIVNTVITSICFGESYEGYTETGVYEDVFEASNGCDSLRIIDLDVEEAIMDSLMVVICNGESFEGYTETGVYEDVFEANNGCDSLRIIDLDVEEAIMDSLKVVICNGESYEGYTEEGIYEDVFEASNGCDSTRVLDLDVSMMIQVTDTTIVADSGNDDGNIALVINDNNDDYSFEWSNGETSSAISDLSFGNYSVTVTDAQGCIEVFEFEVELNTSTNDLADGQFRIFPNPAIESLNIQLKNPELEYEINSIVLMDFNGKKVRIWNGEKRRNLSLENIESGVYILQIAGSQKTFTQKVLILEYP